MKKPYNKPFVRIKPVTKYTRLRARILTAKLNSPEIQKFIKDEIFNQMLNCYAICKIKYEE